MQKSSNSWLCHVLSLGALRKIYLREILHFAVQF